MILFRSQIHTPPAEVTEHLQSEEYVLEEVFQTEVLYSQVKSSTVTYSMRQGLPDGPRSNTAGSNILVTTLLSISS